MVTTKKPAPPTVPMPPIGRDARDGRFTTVEEARRQPATHVVERNKKPKL